MSKTHATFRPFGWKDRVGYMLGNVANDFTFIFASLYLQVFYTDVLGINAGLVGTMFLISRIVDAFTDTAMGRICDKTKATKNGKFKPWLLRACGPVALASFLMYQTFAVGLSMPLRIVYMFITYLLWGSICYTCINIPYGSMASVMSNEPDDRASLSTFRGVGSMIPQILVGVVVPMFLYTTLEDGTKIANASAFPIVALVSSVLAVLCYIICYFMCTERVKVSEEGQSISFKDTLKALAGKRDDGTIYAVCSFSRKLGQAIASALGGWSLGWIGYMEGSMIGQTESVKNGIYNIATLVPMILYLAVAICLVVIYPLSKKKVTENTEILKLKRGE